MKPQKIYSIIIGLVAYIIISHIFHVLFRGKTDIALSLLYIYNDMLYINSSLKFEIMAKQLYVASQRVL